MFVVITAVLFQPIQMEIQQLLRIVVKITLIRNGLRYMSIGSTYWGAGRRIIRSVLLLTLLFNVNISMGQGGDHPVFYSPIVFDSIPLPGKKLMIHFICSSGVDTLFGSGAVEFAEPKIGTTDKVHITQNLDADTINRNTEICIKSKESVNEILERCLSQFGEPTTMLDDGTRLWVVDSGTSRGLVLVSFRYSGSFINRKGKAILNMDIVK